MTADSEAAAAKCYMKKYETKNLSRLNKHVIITHDELGSSPAWFGVKCGELLGSFTDTVLPL